MITSQPFDILAFGAPAIRDSAVVIAASRAGALGVVDLTAKSPAPAADELATVRRYAPRYGVRLQAGASPRPSELDLDGCCAVILAGFAADSLAEAAELVRAEGRLVLAEVLGPADLAAAEAAGLDGLIGRGNEAGGLVGDEMAFILLQRLAAEASLPFWIAGGIGPDSAAACVAAGARGVVLERQLALTVESALPEAVRAVFARCDGSETTILGAELGVPVRVFDRPHGLPAVEALRRLERELADQPDAWRREVLARLGWGDDDLWPVGQDVAFAAPLAGLWRTVGGVVQHVAERLEADLRIARARCPLAAGAPLAAAHRTEFAVVQGPMTRVSDTAAFALAVAEGGGLPFLALALLDGERSLALLQETQELLGQRSWGVGILGFVPPELRAEQLAAIERVSPPFALIAGGRPSQAKQLEERGIPTYLHVPSPALLESFVNAGARRFIFEGRECGGHIGPRSSLVLWQQAVDVLAPHVEQHADEEFWLLFAGGVHDAVSTAAVSALAAPLVERGAKVGVLVGTAYLFCDEAIGAGAIVEPFREAAAGCAATTVIETSPGHAIRIVPSPAVERFREAKRELEARGLSSREVGAELEKLNLGRLRIASKGIGRNPAADPAERYIALDAGEQRREGLYMIGQVAALRSRPTTIRALHEELARGAERIAEPPARPPVRVIDPADCQVAVIGMAGLLPGAGSAREFWENILARVDSVTEVPRERWDPEVYFDPDSRGGDKTYSKWGGFLGTIEFDPLRYGIPPNSLHTIEPVHLLALEVTRAALCDAGYEQRPFCRERTAVVFGAGGGSSDLANAFGFRGMLAHFLGRKPGLPDPGSLASALQDVLPRWCEDTFPGVLINVIAGRIANRFDFGGANFTVDAACASSLAAVDAAIKELRLGHADVAVAGGADTTQDIFSYLLFANSLVLSPRGRCRPFDEGADGIAISEGVAAVVLKRLDDAERDGDRIYAVVRGLAASSDGRALGLTAPNLSGQQRAVAAAYQRSGIDPATVGLVEAHGTGTAVGDRAEVRALTEVYAPRGAEPGSVAIGSVKSNIGHTKCTAGLASLIKVSRALYHRVLPPTIGIEKLNEKAGFGSNPFYPNAEPRPWLNGLNGHLRRAAVSAFGFGGTNFHCVLEEHDHGYLPREATTQRRSGELICLTAPDRAALAERCRDLSARLDGVSPALVDLAYSLDRQRGEGVRLALVARDVGSLREQLVAAAAGLAGEADEAILARNGIFVAAEPLLEQGEVAFLFPGQGSQAPFMLGELAVHFAPVLETLEAADRLLLDAFAGGLSRFVFPPSAYDEEARRAQRAALTDTAVAQPALGAVEAAALALLRWFGLRPALCAGHSYGEYVALHAAGALGLEDLLRVSAVRGRIVAEAGGDGGMAAVAGDAAAVEAALNGAGEITLANLNSPRQTVIAGPRAALEAALGKLKAAGLSARPLEVSCAFHSPLVAPAAERLAAELAELPLAEPAVPVYSNTTAAPHRAEQLPELLASHLVRPVRFVEQIEAMHNAGARIYVEVGPGRVLTGLVERILDGRPHLAAPLDDPQDAVGGLLRLLARLWVHGAEPTLERLYEGRAPRLLELNDLAALRPAEPAPTTWCIAGGRSWPAHGEPAPPREAPPAQVVAQPASDAAPADSPALAEFQAAMTRALEQQQAMVRETLESQQRIMERYLEAQRTVMTAYFGGRATELSLPAAPAPVQPAPAAEPPAPAPAPAPAGPFDLMGLLVRLVAERTGYPPESLNVDLDMEAELGIDSIKRIEILSGLAEKLPISVGSLDDQIEELAQQKTLRQVVRFLESRLLGGAPAPARVVPVAPAAAPASGVPTRRFVLEAVAAPADGERRHLSPGQVLLIPGPDALTAAVAKALNALGLEPVLADLPRTADQAAALVDALAEPRGVVLLESIDPADSDATVAGWFLLCQAVCPRLREVDGALGLLALTGCGGAFGVGSGSPLPSAAAVAGVAKSAARELPGVAVKAIDLDPSAPPSAELLLDELLGGDPAVEVGLGAARVTLRCVERAAEGAGVALDSTSVVLLLGGARGITAEVAAALAAQVSPTLILAGRTPPPPPAESPATKGMTDLAELKAAIGFELEAGCRDSSPAAIEAAHRALLREREVRATLARLREAGATVEYHSLDATDAGALAALIDDLHARHGRLDAVFHAAGVIEDKRLVDKSLGSFQRVWRTKVETALGLVTALERRPPRLLVMFGSVAGRFGNVGQVDYAAANEYLSRLARLLDVAWPTRVVTVNWGAWDEVGMVSPELRAVMRQRGFALIAPADGTRLLLDELAHGAKGEPEVVIAPLTDEGELPA